MLRNTLIVPCFSKLCLCCLLFFALRIGAISATSDHFQRPGTLALKSLRMFGWWWSNMKSLNFDLVVWLGTCNFVCLLFPCLLVFIFSMCFLGVFFLESLGGQSMRKFWNSEHPPSENPWNSLGIMEFSILKYRVSILGVIRRVSYKNHPVNQSPAKPLMKRNPCPWWCNRFRHQIVSTNVSLHGWSCRSWRWSCLAVRTRCGEAWAWALWSLTVSQVISMRLRDGPFQEVTFEDHLFI